MNRHVAGRASALWSSIVLIMLAGAGGQACAAGSGFPDTANHWGKTSIEWAADQGIVRGYEDGLFRPDQRVSEPEFLAMLIRAFPAAYPPAAVNPGEEWHAGYYLTADRQGWPVLREYEAGDGFNRGQVARLIASTQGKQLGVADAVRYLLDRKLSDGKTSPTPEGYAPADPLTRAEAVKFLRNVQERGLTLEPAAQEPGEEKPMAVRGISIGDSESEVTDKLGQPARKDLSRWGFEWYVYNQDPANYTQVGLQDGRVVGLYTVGSDWRLPGDGVKPASTMENVQAVLGQEITSIVKGNMQFNLLEEKEADLYLIGNSYVKLFYDLHENGRVSGIEIIEKKTEEGLRSYYGEASDRLRQSFERESFDLANAARAQRGLPLYVWNDKVAEVSRLHSQDMAVQGYFEHESPSGAKPWDRAAALGLEYSLYAENIAAGQQDAVEAHHGWMNSMTGHRENLLGEAEELGVGVYFGGDMAVHYTQNFYTAN